MRARPTTASQDKPASGAERTFLIGGHRHDAPRLMAGLHLIATPIGNLGDITLRALQTLASADLIACEDTRVTRKLLDRYGIATPLTPYHEHNAAQARPKILSSLRDGAAIALVSDAGTPLISDPGFKLVREVCAAGLAVSTLPGPSSVLAALSLAALPTDRFFYEGFLPSKQKARRDRIAELARIEATLVLFESGARIADALGDLAELLGAREAAICREMTKLHEEVQRASLQALAKQSSTLETRGEFVLVIAPPAAEAAMDDNALDTFLVDALRTNSVKDAVAQAADASGRPKRDVYARALSLSKNDKQ